MKRQCLYVAASAFLLLAACGTNGGGSLSSRGRAASEYWFDSLAEMVATSDIVILGTVVGVRDGTTEGPPGEEIQHLDAAIHVDESFYGSVIETSTITVQTLKFVAPEQEWREVGSTVLAFLKLSTDAVDEGRFYAVNDQSVYLVMGTDIQTAVEGDSLSEQIGAMTIDDFRGEMVQVTPAIEAGRVTPQPPVGG